MAFNRIADPNLDAENPRTAIRHLPKGLLGVTANRRVCNRLRGGVRRFDVDILVFELCGNACA